VPQDEHPVPFQYVPAEHVWDHEQLFASFNVPTDVNVAPDGLLHVAFVALHPDTVSTHVSLLLSEHDVAVPERGYWPFVDVDELHAVLPTVQVGVQHTWFALNPAQVHPEPHAVHAFPGVGVPLYKPFLVI
jgi:hypothetical protein